MELVLMIEEEEGVELVLVLMMVVEFEEEGVELI